MKKVMCIKDGWKPTMAGSQAFIDCPKPYCGEVLEVDKVVELEHLGMHYVFGKYGYNICFHVACFATLDGPDEMDILAERSISDDKVREMINKYKTK